MHIINKTILIMVVASIAVPALADEVAATAPLATLSAAPTYMFTANLGLASQYVYRGITQTAGKPAIQGGADLTHASGLYIGSWASNISWFTDNPGNAAISGPQNSANVEWNFYGGYRNTINDVGFDIGLLQYFYPGSYGTLPAGVVKPDTTEAYVALTYLWLTGKMSYVASSGLFGVANASGSYYADLTLNIPIKDGWTVNAHVGNQKYAGTAVLGGPSNDGLYSYIDYKLGVSKDFGKGWNASAYYTTTNAKNIGYQNVYMNNGANLGADHFVVAASRTF